jgi:hypothetical protein
MSWTTRGEQKTEETANHRSAQLRAAEQRIKELETKVRYFEDRADRAERWVFKIWVESEKKFFGEAKL